ncbi:MAG: hypothetical protein ACI9WT_000295 [Flavobacterium sp.]|jgi:hypothetical protein
MLFDAFYYTTNVYNYLWKSVKQISVNIVIFTFLGMQFYQNFNNSYEN